MNIRKKRLSSSDLIDLRDGNAEIRVLALKADNAFNEERYEAAYELYNKLDKLPKVTGHNWQIYSQIGILHSKFWFQPGDLDALEVETMAMNNKIKELSIQPTGWLADCLKQSNDLLRDIKENKKKKRKRTERDEPEMMQAEVVETFAEVIAVDDEEMTENRHPPKRQKIAAASNTTMIYIAIEVCQARQAQRVIPFKVASGRPKPTNAIVNKLVELVQKADKHIEDDEPLEAFYYINNAYTLMYKNKECFNENRGPSWYKKKIKWIAEKCELAVSLMSDIGKIDTYIEKYEKLKRATVNEWSEKAIFIAKRLLNGKCHYGFGLVMDELKGKLALDNDRGSASLRR